MVQKLRIENTELQWTDYGDPGEQNTAHEISPTCRNGAGSANSVSHHRELVVENFAEGGDQFAAFVVQ